MTSHPDSDAAHPDPLTPRASPAPSPVEPPGERPAAARPASQPDPASLSRLAGIQVRAAVEVGGAELSLRDLAALRAGSVVRLDRLLGEPAELTVNGRPFARGDLVVVGDHFGLRITELTAADGGPHDAQP